MSDVDSPVLTFLHGGYSFYRSFYSWFLHVLMSSVGSCTCVPKMMEDILCGTAGPPSSKRQSARLMDRRPPGRHSMLRPRPSMPTLEKFNFRQFELAW